MSFAVGPASELGIFLNTLFGGIKIQRRFALVARWLTHQPYPGTSVRDILIGYFTMLLYDTPCISMNTDGISLFANGRLTIQYNWLSRTERDAFVTIFVERDTNFTVIDTHMGNRFHLSKPVEHHDILLPMRIRLALARESLIYISRRSPDLRDVLLGVLQHLALTRPPIELVMRAEYALQSGIALTELTILE